VPSNVKNKSRQTSKAMRSSRSSAPKCNKRKFQSSAVQFLYDRYVGNHPVQIEAYEQEVLNRLALVQRCEVETEDAGLQRSLVTT
jgi:hypothetical protein